MTNDEIQRVMEFIIRQQESFSEKMEQFSEKLERMREQHEVRLRQLEISTINLHNTVDELGKAQRVLTVKMLELAEAQAHTDQRLNALIDIIEEGRGGKSQG